MRPAVLLATLTLCATSLATARAAPPLADRAEVVEVFSVQNADEYRDHFVVLYPADCDPATGLPYAGGQERDDYTVVAAGIETPMPSCKGSQLHVVEREGFDLSGRDGVPELDAMGVQGRAEFFARDPRSHATRHHVKAEHRPVSAGEPLRKIHDVLRIERDDDDFFVIGERVVYGHVDGSEEVIPFIAGRRPPPSGKSATAEPRVRLSSDIPRWPWILGAVVVFVGMALYGLRRRS